MKKRNKQLAKKRHLVAWGDKYTEFGDEEKKKEEAFLCLMVMEGENIEINESYSNTLDDDDVDDLYREFYDYLINAKIHVSLLKKLLPL